MKKSFFFAASALLLFACTPEQLDLVRDIFHENSGDGTVKVTGITLDRTNAIIKEGESVTLVAIVVPGNAANKAVVWASSSEGVAKVENGKVTGVKAGTATITATTVDGGKKATCTVTVESEGGSITPGDVPVQSVSLDRTEYAFSAIGSTVALKATVNPSNASNKSVTWTSSKTSVATVDQNGKVTSKASGSATITVKTADGGKTATCTVTVSTSKEVDLGLSVKWASCNLSTSGFVSSPEQYGDYYAWGELAPYYATGHSQSEKATWKEGKTAGYAFASYKWCKGTETSLTKYNSKTSYGIVDNKEVLEASDDAATVKLGGKWRIPTRAEWKELQMQCTWTWTTQNGVNGRLVKGSNGNSIFLPAAGYRKDTGIYDVGTYGHYWSSSLVTDKPGCAWRRYFTSSGYYEGNLGRQRGYSIRPVTD